jgi:Na+/proline symporter
MRIVPRGSPSRSTIAAWFLTRAADRRIERAVRERRERLRLELYTVNHLLAMQVRTGRIFVVLLTIVAYVIAMRIPQSIFDIATQYAFAGYSALAPLLVAALFWRSSTKWGALAVTLWTAAAVLMVAVVQTLVPAPAPGAATALLSIGGIDVVTRATTGMMVLGLLPVVPMTIISAFLMVAVSALTPQSRPRPATIAKYFSG